MSTKKPQDGATPNTPSHDVSYRGSSPLERSGMHQTGTPIVSRRGAKSFSVIMQAFVMCGFIAAIIVVIGAFANVVDGDSTKQSPEMLEKMERLQQQ